MQKMIVTCALPYANGDIHLGHLVGYIQADIWVRYQKMRGNQCYFVCGADTHGTPIMIKAQQDDIAPETMVAAMAEKQHQDFSDFQVDFDNFYTTHSEENKQLASLIYNRLKERGDIVTRTISQAYDPEKNIFLPDRFVKGECPKCHAQDQYGDSCEECGSTYSPTDLLNPKSVLTGATPIEKESLHYFFKLSNYQQLLEQWTRAGHLQPQVTNKLEEWFETGLKEWDISRDSPYFGFEIPDAPGKYFYVWMDAPIGYLASFKNLCDKQDIDFDEFTNADSETQLYHFIGKDIIYFHSLFWPAMLHGASFRLPTAIYANGFLTINGNKMSKSRGTFINGRDYLKNLDPLLLRYYYAAKLNSHIEDIDLNLTDFMQRVNSDLVGKYVNIASRCAGFIRKKFDNQLSESCMDEQLLQTFIDAGDDIAQCFETREFSRAVRTIMELTDKANQFIDEQKPWVLAKDDTQSDKVHQICSMGINLFRLLTIYLKPIIPSMAEKVEAFLQIEPLNWDDRLAPLLSHNIAKFKPLLQRVEQAQIDSLLNHE